MITSQFVRISNQEAIVPAKTSVTISTFVMVSLILFATLASAQSPLENLPYSGGVLVARAIRAGRLHVETLDTQPELFNPDLTCSPAPCVLPNFNISKSTTPAKETPVTVNPLNPLEILAGANDLGCAQGVGFYPSIDGGKTWKRFCPAAKQPFAADPIVGYDLKGNAFLGGVTFCLVQKIGPVN